ncbi:MAG: DUF3880 domain-containing protein [Pseudodesulfovibrio sp.]
MRPRHATITDEIGLTKSFPADPARFEWAGLPRSPGVPVIFLGLGPEPDALPGWFGLSAPDKVFFVENPEFAEQMPNWAGLVPDGFTRLDPAAFTARLAAGASVARYLPAQRAFPSFFAPLSARLALPEAPPRRPGPTAWLPSGETDLLGRELSLALARAGYTVRFLDYAPLGRHPGAVLPGLLAEGAPDLFLSVNFKGLDPHGLGAAILREAGTRVAIWLVDNPFNQLPAIKSRFWRDTRLFVTDHTFIGPLVENGARWVSHLPLAACPELFPGAALPDHGHGLADRLVFVGRSRFPDRDKFFAGETLPADAGSGGPDERRDYHWWRKRCPDVPLWPGNAARRIGAGAEASGLEWKRDCLRAAGPVTIFGDGGWREADIGQADLRPFVDYYAHLPAIYRESAAVLNVTGMQLPGGLTQRHFDVWSADGFLLTDTHSGLNIFPDELTAPIRFAAPSEIRPLFERFRDESPEKAALRDAWRALILREHTYHNRVAAILTALNLPKPGPAQAKLMKTLV